MTVPTLTDGVVTLRAPRPDDVDGVVEQSVDPTSQCWTTVPVPYTTADAESYLGDHLRRGWRDGTEWGFVLEAEGRFAGLISLRDLGPGRAEVSYGSHPWARGRGHVERGVRLMLEWGFAERALAVVQWHAHVGNWASRRLAWRLGFTMEGRVRRAVAQRGELRDAWVGTLLREDPRQPAAPWLVNPVVEGDGVRLRPFTEADVPRLVEGLGDPATQHWLAFLPREPGTAEARDFLQQVQDRLATASAVTWAVAEPGDDRLLGIVGLYRMQPGREAELGYWTHPAERGRGVAARAGRATVGHAFGDLGLTRLTAYASTPNAPSRRVLAGLGMQETGVQRRAARTGAGDVVDLVGYDLLAADASALR